MRKLFLLTLAVSIQVLHAGWSFSGDWENSGFANVNSPLLPSPSQEPLLPLLTTTATTTPAPVQAPIEQSQALGINFIASETLLPYPIQQQTNANGEVSTYAYANGGYRLIPPTFQLSIDGTTEFFLFGGTVPNFYLLGVTGQKYPLKYAINNGEQRYYASINGQNVALPIANGSLDKALTSAILSPPIAPIQPTPPLPVPPPAAVPAITAPSSINSLISQTPIPTIFATPILPVPQIQFINATALEHPIRRIILTNRQPAYYGYLDGVYRYLASPVNILLNGNIISFTLAGTPPNVLLDASNGAQYALKYAQKNGQIQYYVDVDDQNTQIQFFGANIASQQSIDSIDFIALNSLKYPIKQETLPNGNTIYGLYTNGEYRLLPSTLALSTINYELIGTAPNLQLLGPNDEQTYPILCGVMNGTVVYFVNINHNYIQLPFNDNLLPFSTNITNQQPAILNFVNEQSLPYPVKKKVYSNGETFYYGYCNGTYRQWPYSTQLNINGAIQILILEGNIPNFEFIGTNGATFPIKYVLDANGDQAYYIQVNGHNLQLNFCNGPIEPDSSIQPQQDSQSQQNQQQQQIQTQSPLKQSINFIATDLLPYPPKKISYPNGQNVYGIYVNGSYREIPASMSLTSTQGTIELTPSGTPPSLVLTGNNGNSYPVQCSIENNEISYYIEIAGHFVRLPFGSSLPPMPAPPAPQSPINFVSPYSLPHPVKEKIYPNGEIFYYGYSNGAYRQFPYSVQISHGGSISTFILEGTPNDLKLCGPNGLTYSIKYALDNDNGDTEYYISVNGQNLKLKFGNGPIEPTSVVQPPSGSKTMTTMTPTTTTTPITFVSSSTLIKPIIQRSYANGGQIFYYAFANGKYREIPTSMQLTVNGQSENLELGGQAPNVVYASSSTGISYPIKYAVTQSGTIQYYLGVGNQNILLNFSQGPPEPSEQSGINFVSPSAVPHPIKSVTFPNGVIVYGAYVNGAYKEIPSTMTLSSNNGNAETLTVTGTSPNVCLVNNNTGLAYPIQYSIENGQQSYYIIIDGQNVQLPYSNENLPVLPQLPTASNIDFINGNSLPDPIHRIVYPNGETIYYGYSNGEYRELPFSVQLTENGVPTTLTLDGTPPNLMLTAPDGTTYPIKYAIQSNQIQYYININGFYMKMHFGGGPVQPTDTESSNQQMQQNPIVPANSIPTNFVQANTLPNPIKEKIINGKKYYFAYTNGAYREIPYSVQLTSGSTQTTLVFGGTAPNIVLTSATTGTTFPVLYAIENGQQQYYIHIGVQNIQLNLGDGPVMPSSSEIAAANAPSPQQETSTAAISSGQSIHFLSKRLIKKMQPIEKITYPNGQTIYGALLNGTYHEIPSTLQLSSGDGTVLNLSISGQPPNVALVASDGTSYTIKYALQNNQFAFYIKIDQQYLQLPFGSQNPIMPSDNSSSSSAS